jgi:hypothetical protein
LITMSLPWFLGCERQALPTTYGVSAKTRSEQQPLSLRLEMRLSSA